MRLGAVDLVRPVETVRATVANPARRQTPALGVTAIKSVARTTALKFRKVKVIEF